ncbi:aminoglycoside phosphotransferase family protein [Actinomadura montaniterrae]|uniref:Aminoglycoside phosphotransferase family protein n=1 Tax=Actinomadura montaniterrae TaxID=1803903 RepID=A0A6L3VPX9_9ACTN|nr:aminoglycoside phosphotransferase family protein [Actinomadura montaniterrae]KAB2371382.1 aminoglycoside phosphotransferase family protein [Actinomadura montaniterrae]
MVPSLDATPAVPPPAAGERLPWTAVPAVLRAAVEDALGGRVAEAATQRGGFSPGVAARLRLADGRRAFVKAVGPTPNPDSPGIHRSEASIAAALPAHAPTPAFLGSFDRDGWVVLLFEDIDGAPPAQPWNRTELDRVLASVSDLSRILTPAPAQAPSAESRFADEFRGWRLLADAHRRGEDDLTGLDPWAARHLPRLAAREPGWPAAVNGTTLAHADLRADNLLLTPDRVVVVDWPWACTAAPWFDLLLLLPSVRMQGGPPCEELFAAHPLARDADPDAVTTALIAWAGFLVRQGRQPPPPGLPTLRAFQTAQGVAALEWLQTRIDHP